MKNKTHIAITIIIIFFVLLSLKTIKSFSYDTLARYTSFTTSELNVDIAVPIIEDTIEEIEVPLSDMVPGESKEYTFSVTNTKNGLISETSLNYTVQIENTPYLPLDYELQKDNVTTNVLNGGISPIYVLPHSVPSTNNYRLIINWDNSYDTYNYANLVEAVTIIIRAEQKMS